jgi:ParB-like chromosome segregation protein Spo0J
LAGHHVWQAAKDLGWSKVAVTWVDGDDNFCRKIVLADNRTADLGTYRHDDLVDLLESLPDLTATGYEFIPVSPDKEVSFTKPRPEDIKPRKQVIAGHYRFKVDLDDWELWEERLLEQVGGNRAKAARQIGTRLGLKLETATKVSRPNPDSDPIVTALDTKQMPIDSVQPFHHNAREGDVGAIAQSLITLGQYRPIVVNKSTREILVGNHTWYAAKSLGWKQIAVSWVDVDEETATRIVLIDNRSTDLATYDEALLRQVLLAVPTLEGTGWDGDDVDDLLKGMQTRAKALKKMRLTVGGYKVPVETDALNEWLETLPRMKEIEKISDLLGLPISDLPY